jgi:hypothetical protein
MTEKVIGKHGESKKNNLQSLHKTMAVLMKALALLYSNDSYTYPQSSTFPVLFEIHLFL